VICRPADEFRMAGLLFAETGTIGIRRRLSDRHVMDRSVATVDVAGVPVRIKRVRWGETDRSSPEYEDCRLLAAHLGLPLREAERRIADRLRDLAGSDAAARTDDPGEGDA
jgi:uncharacterized protein (DUF111 family)